MSRRVDLRAASALLSFVFLPAGVAHAQLFQAPATQTTGDPSQVLSATLGDLNADGKADLVVSLSPSAAALAFSVQYATPDGFTRAATLTFPTTATTLSRMTLADVDADGQLDLVVASPSDVAVYWGTRDGNVFGATPTLLAGFFGARDVAVADFNGDGLGDLAVADPNNGSTTLFVLPGAGNRQFGTRVGVLAGALARPFDIAVGDVDGDGRADLFGLSSFPSTMTLIRNQGDFVFAQPAATVISSTASGLAWSLAVADVNHDGKADATAYDGASGLVTALGAADGTLTIAGRQNVPAPFGAELTVADLNGDRDADLLIGSTNNSQVAILLGRGDGTFTAATMFRLNGYHDVTTGDVNGDGALDIVGVADGGQTVALHVDPLRVSAAASAGTAGADGTAVVTATGTVTSGHSDVSFTWFEGTATLGTGATVTTRLGAGDHTLSVRAATTTGLYAFASATLTIAGAPASQTSVTAIQQALDARLDAAVSTRASQVSVTALGDTVTGLASRLTALDARLNDVATQTTLASIGTAVAAGLDLPVSTRASAADVAAIGTKIDRLQASLPAADATATITNAIAALGTSLQAHALRIAIEQSLGRLEMVASFYLPTANGGQLDLVRTIVADVVDRSEAAGGNATNVLRARKLLADGDARKASGDYRGAYLLYAGGYNALAFILSR